MSQMIKGIKAIPLKDRLFFATVYFVQGAMSLAALAKVYFLKDTIGLSEVEAATLDALVILPWTIKPLYGFISDAFPIFKRRRKPYLLFASLINSIGWIYFGLFAENYAQAIIALLVSQVGLGITDVIADGLVIEKSTKETVGKLQSLCWTSIAVAGVVTSLVGGKILDWLTPKQVFLLTAALPLLTFIQAIFVDDKKMAVSPVAVLKKTFKGFWESATSRTIIFAALFLFIWRATPAAGKPFTYFLINDLRFDNTFLGVLGFTGGIGNIIGAFLFNKWFDKTQLRKLFFWTILIGSVVGLINLGFIFRLGPLGVQKGLYVFAIISEFFLGAIFYISFLPLLKLAAIVCPKGIEATLFALLASIMNIGLAASTWFGAIIAKSLHVNQGNYINLHWLIIITTLSGLVVLPFIKLIPKNKTEPEALPLQTEDIHQEERGPVIG